MRKIKFVEKNKNLAENVRRRKGKIELKGYRIFETVRGSNSGGGLLNACLASLEPLQVHEGDDECELLVIQTAISDINIR